MNDEPFFYQLTATIVDKNVNLCSVKHRMTEISTGLIQIVDAFSINL